MEWPKFLMVVGSPLLVWGAPIALSGALGHCRDKQVQRQETGEFGYE